MPIDTEGASDASAGELSRHRGIHDLIIAGLRFVPMVVTFQAQVRPK